MRQNKVKAAVNLFKLGLKVIPLDGKIPLLKNWPKFYQENNITEANISVGLSNNGKKVTFLNHNIGVITGAISQSIVIDIDSEEAIRWLKSKGEIPRTWLSKTKRGFHLYFNYNPKIKSGKLHEKIDILSDGKLVVAPPSIHPEGYQYKWIYDPWTTKKEDLPSWLHNLISHRKNNTQKVYNKIPNKKRDITSENIDWLEYYSRFITNIKGTGLWRNGKCPFHSDKHNSFGFHLESGGYHCFAGCGSGSGIHFIQRIHSIPYNLAVKVVKGEDVYSD
jgi:Bifunctional DNA primase/polymerase, N-terminal/CHC2 zinc finger